MRGSSSARVAPHHPERRSINGILPSAAVELTDASAIDGSKAVAASGDGLAHLFKRRVSRALRRRRLVGAIGTLRRRDKQALRAIDTLDASELSRFLQQEAHEAVVAAADVLDATSAAGADESTTAAGSARGESATAAATEATDAASAWALGDAEDEAVRASRIEAEVHTLRSASHYVELSFDAQAAGMRDEERLGAARAYDGRHAGHVGATQLQLATLRFDPTSLEASGSFKSELKSTLRNRYYVHEKYDPFGRLTKAGPPRVPKRFHRYHRPWTLEDSQWVPRRTHGNSGDFFETYDGLKLMLASDWALARDHHVLAMTICRAQLPADELAAVDKEKAGEQACVEAVHEVLQRHALLVYNAFDYYAMLDKRPSVDVLNRSEIFYVSSLQFFSFVMDTRLEDDKRLDLGQIETIFSVVDAPDASTRPRDHHNGRQALNRHEWLQVLVRLAMRKFLHLTSRHASVGNVAGAVEELCVSHLQRHLPRVCHVDPNEFRKLHCYREGTDGVLREHRPSLRSLYDVYSAQANHGVNDDAKLADTGLMSLGEWLSFVEHAGLIELGLLTSTQATQAFAWSRVRCARSWSHRQEIRIRHLMFEDFSEALVRVASIVPLPTLAEVEQAGTADAGEFLLALRCNAPDAFRQFVAHRTSGWGEAPPQRIHRCVEHLLALVRRVVTANSSDDPDRSFKAHAPLSKGVVEMFFRRRHGSGGRPRALVVPTGLLGGVIDVEAAMARVARAIFAALRAVLAFDCLSDADVAKLHAAMSVAKFLDGEYVFEQGQAGDVFYLITSGEAEVLHYAPADPKKEEALLAVLGTSDCFGETALLRAAPRNASIMAKGDLHVAYLSRAAFEQALGRSLGEMRLAHDEQDALRLAKCKPTGDSDAVGPGDE